MRPFAIKGLGRQYTNAATLLCGDANGYSDNAAFDGNEQMTARHGAEILLRMETHAVSANPREHQGRRRPVKFRTLQGVLRTLPSVTVSNCC